MLIRLCFLKIQPEIFEILCKNQLKLLITALFLDLSSYKDFNNIIIKYVDGDSIYIRDIGWVEDAGAIQTNVVRINGKRQVYLPIFKRPGANTIEAVETIKNSLELLGQRLPEDVHLNIIFDQSNYIRNSINSTIRAGLSGLILVVVVLILFLGNFRSALIAALSLPLSIMFALTGLYFTGQSINTVTLGGLALVLGLMVDNSIVVLETTDRHIKMGKSNLKAAMDAAAEVSMPVLASTLAIVVVFVPVIFLSGIARYLFSPLAMVVTFAMAGSYIFSLTLIPVAAAKILKIKQEKPEKDAFRGLFGMFNRFIEWLVLKYRITLGWVLGHRWQVLSSTVLIFIISLFFAGKIGYELFPSMDVGQLVVYTRMEPGTPLEESEFQVEKMENLIKQELGSELDMIVSNIGVFFDLPAAWTPNSGTQDAFIKIQLTENHKIRTKDLEKQLREKFRREFPGIEFSFNKGGMITAALNEGITSPIDIQVQGNDLYVANSIARRIRDTVVTVRGTRDVRIMQRLSQPFIDIRVDREKAAELGVDAVDATKNLVSALNSSTSFAKAFWIDENNGNHYFVGVTYPEYHINSETSLMNVTVTGDKHQQPVPLKNFASLSNSSAPSEINHLNLTRVTNVYVNVEDSDIGTVSSEITRRLEVIKASLPPGYEIALRGEVQSMKESFSELRTGFILAIILVYLIIVPLFGSWKQPLIVIFTIPLGLIGVIWMLYLTKTYISIQSIMGIIMMTGISVAYGNILIDRINARLKQGESVMSAIIEGAGERLRPVLMTMLTTVMGLLPLAMGFRIGSEANVPLARTIIGGIIVATGMTLIIIPILYSFFTKTVKQISPDEINA
ncbi:MAG TPA: efflux RND transporter permease subunit [Bacteroides sp.]|nr:efflux RND transporter permease subunit [Bacteroides sp.]